MAESGRLFVDTSGWYALMDRQDTRHRVVAALVQSQIRGGTRLVTTDYVIDESCTLAKVRSGSTMAVRLLDLLRETSAVDVEWVGAERFEGAEEYFRKHSDQGFSFTDCTSFVVMRELRIHQAITTDDHFRVAGFRVLPEARK